MPDMRYLKRRHHRYWFQIAVPKSLWGHYERRVILENLETTDLSEAQTKRWSCVAKWREAFRRATYGEKLTPEEIEAEAQSIYRRELTSLKNIEPSYFDDSLDPVMDTLTESLTLLYEVHEGAPFTTLESDIDPNGSDTPLVTNAYPGVESEISEFIQRTGAVKIDDVARREIGLAFLLAKISALETAIARRRGQDAPRVGVLNKNYRGYEPVAAADAKATAPFSRLVKDYLTAIAGNWTQKTRQQNETAYRLFQDHVDDKPLAEVTRGDAVKFFDRLSRLRPRWASSPKAKGMPLNQLIIERGARPGERGLSEKTQARYRSALYSLFAWAISRELFDQPNPFAADSGKSANRERVEDTSWQHYEVDELIQLFSGLKFDSQPDPYTHKGSLAWIMAIAVYSGARLEEIAGLRTADVREENGVFYFDLENSARRLKTLAARRKIPIHSELIRLGFLDYASYVSSEKHNQLYPNLIAGDGEDTRFGKYVGKRFNAHRERCGVTRDRLSFHSFRATVITALDRAGVPENHTAQLLGHKIRTMSYGLYSGGLNIEGLNRVVEAIDYPNLILDV